MGRQKKPAALKVLEGNPGKKRIPTEPIPPVGMPTLPEFLDEYAKTEWDRIVDGLYAMKVLAEIDQQVLAAYCTAYSRWRHAEEELQALVINGGVIAGLVHKTISGNYIQQPLIGIANKAAADMVRYASEFGIGAAARAKLGVDSGKGKESKFTGLIGGKK